MKLRFFEKLEKAETILIAGAGGGFDVFCGLPLYFWLRRSGKKVHLVNLSFSEFQYCDGERPVPSLVRVVPSTSGGSTNYFPEIHLSEWLTSHYKEETPIYCLLRGGVTGVRAGYECLVDKLRPDTIILIDGGTDV